MNLIISNKYFKKKAINNNFYFYSIEKNDDFIDLKKTIDDLKPKNIISLDFALQTIKNIENGSIIVAKETISMNSKPINWSVPREDRWFDTSEELNKSICDILEKLTFEHYVGSGIELENAHNIHHRSNAKKWINDNLNGIFIDSYSSRLNEFMINNSLNISIIRIINSSFPITNNLNPTIWNKFNEFLRELYFHKIKTKKIKNEIFEKKLFYEFSKIR
tara:strand:- start:63289 stop:63945 length:657 start_codon:yes stop_codon:yes gene_type:complete